MSRFRGIERSQRPKTKREASKSRGQNPNYAIGTKEVKGGEMSEWKCQPDKPRLAIFFLFSNGLGLANFCAGGKI